MGLNSYNGLRSYCLERAGEDPDDANGGFYDIFSDLFGQAHRDLIIRYPFIDLAADPPGAFVTTDDITTTTLTIASAGTAVTGTLSAAPSASIAGRKIRPSGVSWIARVTAHTAGSTSVTLDAVPAAIAAGTACVIFQDEYELASDLGVFINGLWDQSEGFVPLRQLEEMVGVFSDPPQAASTPSAFARLTRQKIRLSHYPNSVRRYEYPYIQEIGDPSGAAILTIPAFLRPVLAEGALALLFQMKGDVRQPEAQARYETMIERAIVYEQRRRLGLGQLSHQTRQGGYRDTRSRGYRA